MLLFVFSYHNDAFSRPTKHCNPLDQIFLIIYAHRLPSTRDRSAPPILTSLSHSTTRSTRGVRVVAALGKDDKVVLVGLAADSGCGKSTFMRRMTSVFGGSPKPPAGGNPDSNTLISEFTTVLCLDDYHRLDRKGRSVEKVTALDEKAQNFDLMYEQVKALKEGKTVMKPIYNHVSGLLDPAEETAPNKIVVIEGLHPFYDERVRNLVDFKIYLDISGAPDRQQTAI